MAPHAHHPGDGRLPGEAAGRRQRALHSAADAGLPGEHAVGRGEAAGNRGLSQRFRLSESSDNLRAAASPISSRPCTHRVRRPRQTPDIRRRGRGSRDRRVGSGVGGWFLQTRCNAITPRLRLRLRLRSPPSLSWTLAWRACSAFTLRPAPASSRPSGSTSRPTSCRTPMTRSTSTVTSTSSRYRGVAPHVTRGFAMNINAGSGSVAAAAALCHFQVAFGASLPLLLG